MLELQNINSGGGRVTVEQWWSDGGEVVSLWCHGGEVVVEPKMILIREFRVK